MYIISIIGQKGGDGKTMLSIGLAVAAAQNNKAVAIIDLDPQANAVNWRDRRTVNNPAVIPTQTSRLKQAIQTVKDHDVDIVFIDTPGRSNSAAVESARIADLVLIPVRPHIFGIETLEGVRDIIRIAGNPSAYVVINGIHPRTTKGIESFKPLILNTYGLQVAPMHLCQRSIFADSLTIGKSAQEVDATGKAAGELREIYMYTYNKLYKNTKKIPTGKHDEKK